MPAGPHLRPSAARQRNTANVSRRNVHTTRQKQFSTSRQLLQANEGQGALPLEGSIPDMTATTDLFLKLQRLYRSKADEHCSAVLRHARAVLSERGREPAAVSGDDVKLFCRNVRALRVVRFRDIAAQASEVNSAGLRPVRF